MDGKILSGLLDFLQFFFGTCIVCCLRASNQFGRARATRVRAVLFCAWKCSGRCYMSRKFPTIERFSVIQLRCSNGKREVYSIEEGGRDSSDLLASSLEFFAAGISLFNVSISSSERFGKDGKEARL